MCWTDAISTVRARVCALFATHRLEASCSKLCMDEGHRYSKHTLRALMGCVLQITGFLPLAFIFLFPLEVTNKFWAAPELLCPKCQFALKCKAFFFQINEMNVKICKLKQMLGSLLNTAVYPMFNPVS